MNTFTTRTASPLGELILACSDQGLCGVWFEAQRHGPTASAMQCWQQAPDHPLLQAAAAQLQAYFDGSKAAFDLPLDRELLSHFKRDYADKEHGDRCYKEDVY